MEIPVLSFTYGAKLYTLVVSSSNTNLMAMFLFKNSCDWLCSYLEQLHFAFICPSCTLHDDKFLLVKASASVNCYENKSVGRGM